LIRRRRRRN